MKIRKLEIQNYKIFDDVSFDFTDENGETLSTVVLAGMNGCGKTTVLEIMSAFITIATVGFPNTINVQFEIELTSAEKRVITASTIFSNLEPTLHGNLINLLDKIKNSSIVSLSNSDEINHFSSFLPMFFNKSVYFPARPIKPDPNINPLYSKILSLDYQKDTMKKQALTTLNNEIIKNRDIPPGETIDNHVSDITKSLDGLDLNTRLVDFTSEELIFESANGKRIHFEQLSHGEQHLYFRAIYLNQLNLKDAVILIDEPEAAFHPTWQQKIATLYSNVGENNQVFMATHSPHIMASVPPESLFVMKVNEETKKITVENIGKAGKHSKGLEPNLILREVMQVEVLREYLTQRKIEQLAALLTPEDFESQTALDLIEELTNQLGRQDPFIIRLEHQLLVLNRKKQKPVTAE